MMVAWLLYSVVVSALLGLAALAGESALSARGRPVRWAWAAAAAGSLAAPAWARLRPAASVAVGEVEVGPAVLQPAATWLDATATASSPSWDRVLLVLCGVASLAVLMVLAVAHARLAAARRGWGRERVDGVPVYVSRDVGPAALGFFGGAIVIPEWALGLEARLRRLMLLHESEHVRAGDPRLLWLGLATVVAMPWNPVAWWQLRRLRLAIEMDCDARVLRREPDARGYGSLLLEVGRRHSGAVLVAAALAEPQSLLERRLRRLVRPKPRGWLRPAVWTGAAAGLTVLACETPEPTTAPLEVPAGENRVVAALIEDAQARAAGAADAAECKPVYVLDGVVLGRAGSGSPGLEAIESLDPSRIERIEVVKGQVASALAARMGVDEVCGMIRISTKMRLAAVPEALQSAASATSSRGANGRFLALSPEMQAPELRNSQEVAAQLARRYPPLLRNAGIGGTAVMSLWIDETGAVDRHELAQSSGYAELDAAAEAVAATMEFSPARVGDEPKPVVIRVPITFRTQ